MKPFSVTYEVVTPESAEDGEAEEQGYILEAGSLRDAMTAVFETRTAHCDGINAIEASESWTAYCSFRWITVCNGMEFLTGAHESRSLHIPEGVTPSSRRRIARLMGLRGV